MSLDREMMLLAFGSPAEPNAEAALAIILEAIHSEAAALSDADAQSASPTAVRRLALACRLEALKEFVSRFVAVKWAGDEASANG